MALSGAMTVPMFSFTTPPSMAMAIALSKKATWSNSRSHRVPKARKPLTSQNPSSRVAEVIRKPYFPPQFKELSLVELPPQVRKLMELGKLFSSTNSKKSLGDKFRLVLDLRGNCLAVSEAFCKLVGHPESSLVGKSIDSFTAPNLLDVPKNLGFVFHYGAMQGLWMFLRKNGTSILVCHESELLPNLSIQMRVEPITLFEAIAGKD
jgi:hypothetical protein